MLTLEQINELLHDHSVLLENFDSKELIMIKMVEDLNERLKLVSARIDELERNND